MEALKGDQVILECRGKFIMHTGHGAKGGAVTRDGGAPKRVQPKSAGQDKGIDPLGRGSPFPCVPTLHSQGTERPRSRSPPAYKAFLVSSHQGGVIGKVSGC